MEPDLTNAIMAIIPASLAAYIPYVVLAAAILAAVLPQPPAGSPWESARKLLDIVALNVGHSRNSSASQSSNNNTPPVSIIVLVLALSLGACTTAQLQNEAVRLAAINQIVCSVDATVQPILVPLAAAVTVAVDPGTAPAVAGAVALDGKLHPALQALCPAGTALLGAIGSGVPPAPAPTEILAIKS